MSSDLEKNQEKESDCVLNKTNSKLKTCLDNKTNTEAASTGLFLEVPNDVVHEEISSATSNNQKVLKNMPTLDSTGDEIEINTKKITENVLVDETNITSKETGSNITTDVSLNIKSTKKLSTNTDSESKSKIEEKKSNMVTDVNINRQFNSSFSLSLAKDFVNNAGKGKKCLNMPSLKDSDYKIVTNMPTLDENKEESTNQQKVINISTLTSVTIEEKTIGDLSEEKNPQTVANTDINKTLLEENLSNDCNINSKKLKSGYNTTDELNSNLPFEVVNEILNDADILNTSSDIDDEENLHNLIGGKMNSSELILEAVKDLLGDEYIGEDSSTDSNLNLLPQAKPDILSQATNDLLLSDLLDEFIELQPVPMTYPEEPAKTPEGEQNDLTLKINLQTLPVTFVQSESNEPLKIYYIQPLGPDPLQAEVMSLSTLLEAARFLELQEQQQTRAQQAQMGGHLTTTIVEAQGVARPANGVQNHHPSHLIQQSQPIYQNGNALQTRTITLQPIKADSGVTVALNTPIASPVIQQSQAILSQSGSPATQTVVISSNNISSTLLQGPISFPQSSSPPATSSSPTTTAVSIPATLKIEADGHIRIEQDRHISSTTVQSGGQQPAHQVAVGQQQRTTPPAQQPRTYNNSFDIVNPLVIDEDKPDQKSIHKLKQPPMAFRSGTREVHNKLEKHRRAHLKECFDILKKQLMPNSEEKKTSNLSILHSALRCIQGLKRRERELDHEMERLAREKIAHQQRLAVLKKDISLHYDNVDFGKLLPEVIPSSSTLSDLVSSSSAILPQPIPEPVEVTVKTTNLPTVIASNNSNGNGLLTAATNCNEKVAIPILSKPVSVVTQNTPVSAVKEVTGAQSVQTAGISVLPMSYPVNPQGLVLQKVAIVPHTGLKELTPLVSTHFITSPQQLNGINGQINGKMVPITQYLVKPVVVVSTASPRPGS